jgi:hypothetical protein
MSIDFDESGGMVIMGAYNNPKGPRIVCGEPITLAPGAAPGEIGEAARKMYQNCLGFSDADIDKEHPTYKKVKGIRSWRAYARKYSQIMSSWYRDEKIELVNNYRFSNGAYGGHTDWPKETRELPFDASDEAIGETVLELIATMREKGLTKTRAPYWR